MTKNIFFGLLSLTVFTFCSQKISIDQKLSRSDDFKIVITSPDTVMADSGLFASIYIDNPKFNLIHASFACDVADSSTVDTLKGRIYGCIKNLVIDHDSVKIWLNAGPKPGKFDFEEVTLLAKGDDNKYYYQKCTFDYYVK